MVKRIFQMCAEGIGPTQIARQLENDRIYTPTMYEFSVTIVTSKEDFTGTTTTTATSKENSTSTTTEITTLPQTGYSEIYRI